MRMGEGILSLEEKGDWINPDKDIERIVVEMRASRLERFQSGTCEMVDMGDKAKVKVISDRGNLAREGIQEVIFKVSSSAVPENISLKKISISGTCEMVDMGDKAEVISDKGNLAEEDIQEVIFQESSSDIPENTNLERVLEREGGEDQVHGQGVLLDKDDGGAGGD